MQRFLWLLASIIFTNCTLEVFGQIENSGMPVRVEVNDPEADVLIYSGYITTGTNQDTLYLLLKNENIVRIPMSRIISIEGTTSDDKNYEPSEENKIPERSKYPKRIPERREVYDPENGFYFNLGIDINFETQDFFDVHGGAEIVLGYRVSPTAYIGAGFGYRAWTRDVRPSGVGTVFGEFRKSFLKRDVTPYVRLRAGYGNSWHGGELTSNYQSAKGGLFFSPSIGFKLIDNALFHINIETGLQHQQIQYLDLDFGSFERKYTFNRHFIGFSLMYN